MSKGYTYCFNNPLKYTDPSGNITWSDVGAGALIAGGIVLDCFGQEYGTALIVAGGSHFAQTAQNYSQQTPGNRNYNAASNSAGIVVGMTFTAPWGGGSNSTPVNTASSSNNPTIANTSSNGGSTYLNNQPDFDQPYGGGSELYAQGPPGGGSKDVYSGNNLFVETYSHFQTGGGDPLYVSASSLDFNGVSQEDLVYNSKTNTYGLDLYKTNPTSQMALSLGKISLVNTGNNQYTIQPDYYNFNIEWQNGFSKRNIATLGAGVLHYYGTGITPLIYGGPYWINFQGTVTIKP